MTKKFRAEARRRRAGSGWALVLALLPLAGPLFAQARPITTYQGTVGDAPVELLLVHDWQLDGMGGYLFEEDRRTLLPLEKTPYAEGESLLINVLGDPRLPTSAIALRPFAPGAKRLRGRLIELRSRAQREVRLERVTRFSSDANDSYEGELLQGPSDARFQFRVHARKARGEHAGRVDAVTVIDRASGEPVQVLEGLDLFFSGTDTLVPDDFNGDGIVDFSAMPMRADDPSRTGEHRHYFVYRQETGGYGRDPQLEALAAQGTLQFGSGGWVNLRPASGIDYRAGTIQWRHYRYVAPDRLELQGQSEERF